MQVKRGGTLLLSEISHSLIRRACQAASETGYDLLLSGRSVGGNSARLADHPAIYRRLAVRIFL